ncbi:hypothetical protein [Criblamydia sequanensis]|uniref:hypothetical protein n=1 Tax=Candidatus Criblamydia sequanensis TaxID=340071 RepID=UPI00059610C2|nr:hypothetical protein [Criblamydia sequanensis]
MKKKPAFLLLIFTLLSCNDSKDLNSLKRQNRTGAPIYRSAQEYRFTPAPPTHRPPPKYPWQEEENNPIQK